MENWQKAFPVVMLATHKLVVSVDTIVWVDLLATILGGKHMATVMPNFLLVRQGLESLVTYITGMNPFSLSCFLSPNTDPFQ